MITVTTPYIPGREIKEPVTVVTGFCIADANAFGDAFRNAAAAVVDVTFQFLIRDPATNSQGICACAGTAVRLK